jgi:thioesterase domain-containing protein/aryl carrier-like protein
MDLSRPSELEETGRHVAPRDALELQLARIWEDLLDCRPIGVDEDFFQLGGDSLLAMSLLARIVQETGYMLPGSGIVRAPTIEKLAKVLREDSDPANWSAIVPIQTEGTKRPFFCVHPGGGNALCYLQLARCLGPEQPFYGLQCPGVDGIRQPLATAEEMAREYVAAIRGVQARGPYAIGGWSVGGVFAYEVAQQLRAAGEEVRFLAVIDSGILYACAILTALFPKGQMGILDMLRLPSAGQLSEFRRRSAPARLIPDNADEPLAYQIFRLFTSNMHAVINYRPEPYEGKITLFQASEGLVKKRFEPSREWSRLCDDVELHLVPGNHLTLVQEPHVRKLAERLANCLDAAAV